MYHYVMHVMHACLLMNHRLVRGYPKARSGGASIVGRISNNEDCLDAVSPNGQVRTPSANRTGCHAVIVAKCSNRGGSESDI